MTHRLSFTEFGMGFRLLILSVSLMLLETVVLDCNVQAQDKVFLAGAATANITPPLGEPIVGNFNEPLAKSVHDELHARALVLDDGTQKIAFVTCDNVGISRSVFDVARRWIAEETELLPEQVVMTSNHTHSATRAGDKFRPDPDREQTFYEQLLSRRIADSVRLALGRREPARIGWGSIDEPSHLNNRRWFVSDPDLARSPYGQKEQVRMNPPVGNTALIRPAGEIDPQVSFISVQTTDGRPVALLANYSLHYVGGVPAGVISADYFGVFANRMFELVNADHQSPAFVGILTNGNSADVNNINFRERETPLGPYEKMTLVAHQLADRVAEQLSTLEYHDWVPVRSAYREVTLQIRQPDEETRKYVRELMEKSDDAPKFHPFEKLFAERVMKIHEGWEEVQAPIYAIRIGDLGIATLPFEVFAEIGLEIKEKSPFKQSFVMSLANDSLGYLPTPAQHEVGGYETWLGVCIVETSASEKLTASLLEMLNELHESD